MAVTKEIGGESTEWDEFIRQLDQDLIDGKISAERHEELANGPQTLYESLAQLEMQVNDQTQLEQDEQLLPSLLKPTELFALDLRALGLRPSMDESTKRWKMAKVSEVIAAVKASGRYEMASLADLLLHAKHRRTWEMGVAICVADEERQRKYVVYSHYEDHRTIRRFHAADYSETTSVVNRQYIGAVGILVKRK